MRGNVTSLTYWARPWVSRARLGRGTERPIYELGRSSAERPVGDLALVGHSLDGLDARAVALHREHQAAAHDHAIDAHRAGATDAVLAADMAAGEAQVLAQEINQRLARIDVLAHLLAVDGQSDVLETLAHDPASDPAPDPAPMRSAVTRLSSTPARCRLTALVACTS